MLHVALQEDHALFAIGHRVDAQEVAVLQLHGLAALQGQIHRRPAALLHPLEQGAIQMGRGQEPAGHLDEPSRAHALVDLVDGRALHLAANAHAGPGRRHEEHVHGLQAHVAGAVAAKEHVVEIQLAHQFAAALELDVSQTADLAHAAAGKEGVAHGRQAAEHVVARLHHVAEDEDLDGAQTPHGDGHLGADEAVLHVLLQLLAQLAEAEPGHGDGSELGKVDETVAVHHGTRGGLLLAEETDVQFIAGADEVARRDGDVGGRREGAGHGAEEIVAEGEQVLLGRAGFLEEIAEGGDGPLFDFLFHEQRVFEGFGLFVHELGIGFRSAQNHDIRRGRVSLHAAVVHGCLAEHLQKRRAFLGSEGFEVLGDLRFILSQGFGRHARHGDQNQPRRAKCSAP